jgi:hypothetical protein
MSASTLTFAGLTGAYHTYLHTVQPVKESYILALGFQLVGILVGTVFNYELNKRFTWRDKTLGESKISDPKSLSRNSFASMEESPDQASSTEHDFRRMPVVVRGNSDE